MKKAYTDPVAEKIEFCYRDQVTASGGTSCSQIWNSFGDSVTEGCTYVVGNPDSGF